MIVVTFFCGGVGGEMDSIFHWHSVVGGVVYCINGIYGGANVIALTRAF